MSKVRNLRLVSEHVNQDPQIHDVLDAIREIAIVLAKYGKKADEANDAIVSTILGSIFLGFVKPASEFLKTFPFPAEWKDEVTLIAKNINIIGNKLYESSRKLDLDIAKKSLTNMTKKKARKS